ncbi:MAG: PfkB family carbohydrate kinase [Thermoplasmatota archaeon]
MGKLLVCGNLNIDRILEIEYLPREGQSVPVRSQRIVHGGCGGNISISAAKLGTPVMLSSIVGTDLDPTYRDSLEMAGVDLSGLVIDDELPSPCCTVLSAPEGKQAYLFVMGAMEKQGDMDLPATDDIDHLHIATSAPNLCKRASKEFYKKGIPVGFDPAQEIYFRWKGSEVEEVLEYTTRYFGNLGEWEYLMDILNMDRHEKSVDGIIYPFSEDIFGLIEESIVTLGRKGCLIINADGAVLSPPNEPACIVDSTGAGDAFRGAFYTALMKGSSSVEASRFGNAMGALSLSSPSPQDYEADWDRLRGMVEE